MLKSLFPWKQHKTKAMAAQQTMDDAVPEIELQTHDLLPCHVCGRTFLPAPLRKHERICERTSTKKRKPFDSLKQRVEGTDLADFHQKSYLKKPETTPSPDAKRKSRSTWKEKHLALVTAIRAAKGIPSDDIPKTKSTTALMAGTERCPSCDRQFGPKAYDRHVEWCKEKKAQQRIHHSPANVLLAKERLEARTKYVPPLNRSKKTIVRDKYSNHASTETLIGAKSSSPLSRGPSVRKPRSVMEVGRSDERREKARIERGAAGGGDKAKEGVPVIASPSSRSETSKSSQKKRTGISCTKLNDVGVNSSIGGLTVASLVYDNSTRKMVTWKDTVKQTGQNESNRAAESPCRATQSEKLRKNAKKIPCDKILSCNDVVHKPPPEKIPLSKFSFKSKLKPRVKPSEASIVDLEDTHSCNSVSEALDRLEIDEERYSSTEEAEGVPEELVGVVKEADGVPEGIVGVPEDVVGVSEGADPFQNAHKDMSDWFDGFTKGSNEEIDPITEEEEPEAREEDLVMLFRSTTNMDLTNMASDLTLEAKKDVSRETVTTNCELDSIELSYGRPSHFSLRKSTSDMYLSSEQSFAGLSNKNTLVSIYWNKNKEVSDEESFLGSRKEVSSLPNISIHDVAYKTDDQNEILRRKILEIAAKEFVKDCRAESAQNGRDKERNAPESGRGDAETAPESGRGEERTASPLQFLEEEYTVPKKRRKVDGTCARRRSKDVFRFSAAENFDLAKLKALTMPEDDDSESTLCGSVSSANLKDYSPRILALLDNILEGRHLVVMTQSDCRRLIDMDGGKLPRLERRLRRMKDRHAKGRGDRVKLPPIVDSGPGVVEAKEVEVKEAVRLPRIVDRKLRRRDNAKKLVVDIRKEIGDVYLEYEGERGNFNYNPFESAQRQFMELLECDDFKELAPLKHAHRPRTTEATPTAATPTNKKKAKSAEPALTKVTKRANRASVIEPPSSFKDSLDSISDDFELMENLINDNFTDDNKNNNGFYLHLKTDKESLTLSDILNGDDTLAIDPMLINENDNLSIPDHFKIDDYSPTSTTDTDITIRNDIDCYSVQYDAKITAYEKQIEKKPVVKRSVSLVNRESPSKASNKKLTNKTKLTSKSISSISSTKTVNGDKKKGLSTLKRSKTLFDPSPKPPSLKNKNDVNNYFTERESKVSANQEANSPVKEISDLLDETLKPEDLFNVDDEMYEEYKKYEEMYLKEKAQQSATKKHKPKIVDVGLGVHTASEEEERSSPQFINKVSNDSAYGSLTRKTPKHRSRATKLSPLEQKQADSTSSSGSENCPSSPAPANQRQSKFCHECGNKYPLTTAKFCVECGVKRLVL